MPHAVPWTGQRQQRRRDQSSRMCWTMWTQRSCSASPSIEESRASDDRRETRRRSSRPPAPPSPSPEMGGAASAQPVEDAAPTTQANAGPPVQLKQRLRVEHARSSEQVEDHPGGSADDHQQRPVEGGGVEPVEHVGLLAFAIAEPGQRRRSPASRSRPARKREQERPAEEDARVAALGGMRNRGSPTRTPGRCSPPARAPAPRPPWATSCAPERRPVRVGQQPGARDQQDDDHVAVRLRRIDAGGSPPPTVVERAQVEVGEHEREKNMMVMPAITRAPSHRLRS